MISTRQIRAARGLLGWSQAELAARAGLSLTSINNIEVGTKSPRSKTLETIQKVLESEGIQFTSGQGVCLADEVFNIQVFKGPDARLNYLKDIVQTVRQLDKKEVLIALHQEQIHTKSLKDMLYWYCQQLVKYNIKERVVVPRKATEIYPPEQLSEYRASNRDSFDHVTCVLYGNKYAIALDKQYVIIENKKITEAYRKQFESEWASAEKIKQKRLYIADIKKKT